MVVLSLVTLLGAYHAGIAGQQFWIFTCLFLGIFVLPIALFRLYLLLSKKVSDWDVHKRKERIKPLLMLIGIELVILLIINFFDGGKLTDLFTLYFIWSIGFTLITFKTKISGHTGIVTLGALLIMQWMGNTWWPVLFAIPLISWARIVSHAHTTEQAALGIIYSTLLIFLTKPFMI